MPAASGYRPRRTRQTEALRGMIRETRLSTDQLVLPLFVRPGTRIRSAIPSLPGHFQLSIDQLVTECQGAHELGVPAVLLFGVANKKDDRGSGAYAGDGLVQQAVRALKTALPKLMVITDVCLCAYTTHGHCGVLKSSRKPAAAARRKAGAPQALSEGEFWIDNDATVELLSRIAVSHAKAGADMVAPSDMMDGTVGAVRQALDADGHDRTPIMAYAAKFASAFYAPFRDAVGSAPQFGDRSSYQMDLANADEAVREARLDIEQGADIVMVKPALAYLDIIRRIKDELSHPVAAFNVSGEYAMVKAAVARGWLPERPAWLEMLTGLKRAGADILITYWAKDAAKLLREK